MFGLSLAGLALRFVAFRHATGKRLASAGRWITASACRVVALLLALAVLGLLLLVMSQGRANADLQARIAAADAAAQVAERDQATVLRFPVLQSHTIAENSREQSKTYYDQGRAAGLAYAAAHGVQNGACRPAVPGTDLPAPIDDRSGAPSGMVAVAPTDFETLVAAALRLAQVQADATALIEAGVAVPLPTQLAEAAP